ELGSWSINLDNMSPQDYDTNSYVDIESDKEKKAESESDKEEDIQEAVFNSKVSNDTSKDQEENSYINADNVVSKEETPMERSNSSDESRPQGFKHFKNSEKEPSLSSLQSKSGKCSTHLANVVSLVVAQDA
ncbi:hypothetical protein Tco_1580033, partial [Tanacetum coccineum]